MGQAHGGQMQTGPELWTITQTHCEQDFRSIDPVFNEEQAATTCKMNLAETETKTPVAVIYSLALLVGLPLNVLSLWVLIRRHGLRSANTVIMTHLAVSDLLLILTLPLCIYDYVSSPWPFGAILCKVAILVFRTNILSSSFFITFISVDRVLAVSYPLHTRTLHTPRTSWLACVAVWLLAVTHCLPEIDCKERRNSTECFRLLSLDINSTSISSGSTNLSKEDTCGSPPVFVYILVICLVLLFVINLISTATVTQTLCRRKNDLTGHNIRKVILLFTVNLLMFSFFFLPFIIVTLLTWLQYQIDLHIVELIIGHASLNCCLDPIVYYFSFDAFWKKKQNVDT